MATFIKQYTAYGLGVALTRLAALFLLPLYTRYLTPADYGALDTLITLTALLSPLMMFGGVDMGVQILYYKMEDEQGRDDLIISALLLVAIFAALCVAGGLAATEPIVDILFNNQFYAPALRLLFLDLWLITLLKLLLDSMRLDHQPFLYNLMTLSQIVVVTLFNILFVVVREQGVVGYVTGLLLGDLVVVIFAAGFVIFRHRCRPSFRQTPALIRIGLPLLPVSAAYWVINLSNRFFLTQYVSLTDVGLYGIANRLATGFSILSVAIQLGWRPFALSIQSKASSFSLYAKMPLYYFTFVGGFGLVLSALAPWILSLFTATGYGGAAAFVAPLTLAQVMYGAYFIVSTGLEIEQKTYHLTWTVLVAAMVSVGGNFFLIPRWGALGAAVVLAVAYATSSLLVGLISNRVYPLPYDTRRLAMMTGWVVAAYISVTVLLQTESGTIHLSHLLLVIVFGAGIVLLLWPEMKILWNSSRQRLISIRVKRHG